MRKIYLHGALAKKYGKVFKLDVRTAGEAVRALIANFPSLRKDISDGTWHVVRGNTIKGGYALDEKDISTFNLGKADLHIVPYVAGSKRSGGLLKIILGVVLIAGAFILTAGMSAGLAAPVLKLGAFGSITGTSMAIFGLGLALAGVSMLLAPEDKTKDEDDNSFMTNGPGNNSGQGIPIPLVYGEVITGGALVSGGVDVERLGMSGGGGGGRYGRSSKK